MKFAKSIDPETGRLALASMLSEGSPLGALKILYSRIGRFFQIPLPAFHPFVVGGTQSVRKVLVTERDKVKWRNADPVTDLLRHGVLVTDGEEHDQYRKSMEPSLHQSKFNNYVQRMLASTDRVTSQWRDGQVVDMLVESRKIALLIVMDTLFSVDAWDNLPHIWTPILKAIEYISPGAWIIWRKVPRPGYKKHLKQLDDYLYGIISNRRADSPKADLFQHLIDAGLDDDRIRDQMLTMLIAGHDTSTALLAWTFYLLGSHPEVHKKLVRELDESIGANPPSTSGGWQPHLLDEIIKESLRLYPPIHIGNRIISEDMDFDGNCVPAGERLFYSIYLTHRDAENWEAPDSFHPKRFEHGRKQPPYAYIPFGGGPRSCIGAAFGQAEARLVIARLLQTFTFELVNKKVHAHMGATLEPRPGVMMRVSPRK
ncbi:cytochrome P450 family 4 subfamily V [Anaerolineales bacterium]|nr:cytochrome P450 family 4 subfamily V [Anaerolineales bacterium]